VDAPQPRIRVLDRLDLLHPAQQLAELLLPLGRQQEVIERLEAAALVGIRDRVAVAEHHLQQLALAAVEPGDAFPQLPIQSPEIRLYLPEVRQQLARGDGELLMAVALPGRVQQRDLAGLDRRDLFVQLRTTAAQLTQPGLRIAVRPVHHLPQQVEDRVEPRFGADERAPLQGPHPRQRPLHRRGHVEMRLVGTRQVELAYQPAAGAAQSSRYAFAGLVNAVSPSRSLSPYNSSSSRLISSPAATGPAFPSPKTRPRKLSTRAAFCARSKRHAAC
jgi:hypothetical protein